MYIPPPDKYYNDSFLTEIASRITWGEPARIVQVKFDKECPCCSLTQQDGFDIGRDSAGNVFGARCFSCEWTF